MALQAPVSCPAHLSTGAVFFHATYRHHIPSIERYGLGARICERNFQTDYREGVYLASDPTLAIGFLVEKFMSRLGRDLFGQPLPPDIMAALPKENPSELDALSPKDVYESFVVLSTNRIDQSLLIPDPNIQEWKGQETFWFYHGVIPFRDLSIIDR
jgi:hypothetical protein